MFQTVLLEIVTFRLVPGICSVRRAKPENDWKRQVIPDRAHHAIKSVSCQKLVPEGFFRRSAIISSRQYLLLETPFVCRREVVRLPGLRSYRPSTGVSRPSGPKTPKILKKVFPGLPAQRLKKVRKVEKSPQRHFLETCHLWGSFRLSPAELITE